MIGQVMDDFRYARIAVVPNKLEYDQGLGKPCYVTHCPILDLVCGHVWSGRDVDVLSLDRRVQFTLSCACVAAKFVLVQRSAALSAIVGSEQESPERKLFYPRNIIRPGFRSLGKRFLLFRLLTG